MLFLLACTANDAVDTADLVTSPYIYDEDEPAAPELSVEDVAGAVTELIGVLLNLNAGPILTAYEASMSGQQQDCPDYYEQDGSVYWYDYCYAADGSSFSGYGFLYDYVDHEQDGYIYNGQQVYTVSEIVDSEGATFTGGGGAQNLRLDYVGTENVMHTTWSSVINGSFAYDGPGTADSWMGEGLAPDGVVYVTEIPEEAGLGVWGRLIVADGGVGGLTGTANTVVVDTFHVWPAVFGNSCEIEPHGTVSVRDTEGLWYDLVFDGVEAWSEEVVDEADCDGCGTVYFHGDVLGEACVDVSGLMEGGDPW